MSVPASAVDRDAIVARLRAYGCVFAEDEADLLISSAATPVDLLDLLQRRLAGLPLEHVLGWVDFCGLRIAVAPGVFVPRTRTGFLVGRAAALARAVGAAPVVVDLCCGSGAIGAAVAASVGTIRLYAADIDPAAVECARRNVEPYHGQVFQGDLFAALPAGLRGTVHVLVANVPYVPTDAVALMPPEARLHEPRFALDGGADGLDLLRRVAGEAPAWLAGGGRLLVETSEEQAPTAYQVMETAGLRAEVAHSDDLDATAVIGTAGGRPETS